MSEILEKKLKQVYLVTNSDLNTVSQCTIKNEEKIEKPKTFDLSYFLGKSFFDDDGFQIMFGDQLKFNTLDLKQIKGLKRYLLEIK